MLSMYRWQQVKALRAEGVGVKKIARILKISKNTVKKYLKSPDPPQFKARKYTKELDRHQQEIAAMLAKKYIGTRIYEELTRKGYQGSLSSVHRYLRGIKEEEKRTQLATTRVETPPGRQMQYDWKEWELPVGGQLVKIYLHEVVLSYSRKKYYSFSLTIAARDVIRAVAEAIHFFGGVAPELVIDNPKQMVITHPQDGVVYYNEEFLKFCGLYGIQPSACRNYRARTKGKAERPFYYLQEHLLRGLEVESLFEFEEKLAVFRDKYNQRPHSALKESPEERFGREKDHLRPVAFVEPTVLYSREPKKVSSDGYISCAGNLYPVPMRFCLKTVWVESVYGRKFRIYDEKGTLVGEQEASFQKQKGRPSHPEHEEINRRCQEKKAGVRSALVEKFGASFGEAGRLYLAGLKDQVGANLYWHLKEILQYQELYGKEEVGAAIQECLSLGAYHKNSVKRLLEGKGLNIPGEFRPESVSFPRVNIKRELSFYSREVLFGE